MTWVLTHPHPDSSSRETRMAVPWSADHTLEARAQSTSSAGSSASSSVVKGCPVSPGPKVSSWTRASPCRTPVTTVGSKEQPGARSTGLPPVTTLACSGGSASLRYTSSKWRALSSGP